MKKYTSYQTGYRWLAFILCLVLCIESSSMHVLAAEKIGISPDGDGYDLYESTAISDNSNGDDPNETESGAPDDNSGSGGSDDGQGDGADGDSDDGQGDGAGGGSDDDQGDGADGGGDDGQGGGDITVEDDEDPNNPEDTDDIEDSDGTENPDGVEDPEDNEDADDEDDAGELTEEDQISGNDLDSISENDLDSVSDNNLESVSENSLDEEWKRMVLEAEEAFDVLLADRDMMALLYHADVYHARQEPSQDSEAAAELEIGQTLYIQGVRITKDDVWYQVQFYVNGNEQSGYVQSYYLAYSDEDWLAWEDEYLYPILLLGEEYGRTAYGMSTFSAFAASVDTSDIASFPAGYQSALRTLKSKHPNWTFVPMNTGLDFNTAVSKEMGDRSLIQKTTSNSSKGWVGKACPSESGWYYATQPAVAYHMDPRNFISESYIFQFEQLTFNSSYHTTAAVQTFLGGTFMKGKLPDDSAGRTYAQAFYEIGKKKRLSPIHLASRVYQEQGQGTSGLISGTYPGYKGYYNFFNVGVNGSSTTEKIVKGLTYAKQQGWNTRYKSLEGGANTIGKNYILKYQDTIYLEKFNVDKNSPYGIYNHQYMQNIQAPASESSTTKKMYSNAGSLNSAFVFKIPVYKNMPEDKYYPELKLNKTSLTMNKGTEQKLTVSSEGLTVPGAVWKSSDPSVVSVSTKSARELADTADLTVDTYAGTISGTEVYIHALKPGQATISVMYQDVERVCKVTVKSPLQSISLDKTEIRLRRPDTVVTNTAGLSAAEKAENKDSASLQVYFNPEDTTDNKTITWSTSNKKIATVTADPSDSSKAVVKAVGKGDVTITAKASKAGGKKAVCKVHVSAPIYRAALTNPNAKDTDTPEKTTLLAGQKVSLAVEYWPKDTTSSTAVEWKSSAPAVASVKNGRVEALSRGTAVITAKVPGCEQGYTVSHTIVVDECVVTFMKQNGTTKFKEEKALYGQTVPVEKFPAAEEVKDSVFIGWYTGQDGTGSRFDEKTQVYRQKTILYPYYEEQGKGFYVLPVGDQTYTGSSIKPKVQVYDGVSYEGADRELIPLVLNKDYTVSYKNNKNVNTAGKAVPTITVKGKGNYKGSAYVYFNIVPKELTDTDIRADDITVAYSGKTIKSSPTVYRGSKKLSKNRDYTVTYPQTGAGAYKTAGVYPVVIKGKGGYTGTITIYETITREVLMSKVSIAKIPNQVYDSALVDKDAGIGIEPSSLKVTYKKKPLILSTDGGQTGDYTVTFKNNMAIGTATATITAVEGSGYTGSKNISYKITGKSITKAKVTGLSNKEYTGSEDDVLQDAYVLTYNDVELEESRDGGRTGDYVVSYSNTSKVGTARIVFKGVNEYTGQLKKSYKITYYNIGPDENGQNNSITMQYYTQDAPDVRKDIMTLAEIEAPYVKGGSKPVVILYFNDMELKPGKDYTIKYANHNAVTTEMTAIKKLPRITITGKGNFRGSITDNYTITDGLMEQEHGKVTMTAADVVYRNKKNAYKRTPVIKDCNGSKLVAGRDYAKTLEYTYAQAVEWTDADETLISRAEGDLVEPTDIPPAGALIRVTARGMGPYAGTGEEAPAISTTYRIIEADIAKAKVSVPSQTYYNGRPVTLSGKEQDIKVTMSGNKTPLVYGVDYIIDTNSYKNNTKKGKASVVIRGIGSYGGEKKITYTINAKTLAWWK